MPVPNTLRLTMNDTFECVTIAITNDNIVEGTEEFVVSFVETDTNMIMTAGDRTVPVCIEDDEGICERLTEKNIVAHMRYLQFGIQCIFGTKNICVK